MFKFFRGARGFIGEYGVPGTDGRDLLGRGPWYADYLLSVEQRNGEDCPQVVLLTEYSGALCPTD